MCRQRIISVNLLKMLAKLQGKGDAAPAAFDVEILLIGNRKVAQAES